MRAILVILFTLFSLSIVKGQCNNIPVDLNTWTTQGGSWNVNLGGTSVTQTVNGGAVYFLSPNPFINTIISGALRTDDGDNDRMGFVFGVEGTIGVAPFHYYRFEWDEGGDGNGMYVYEYDETGLVSTLLSDVGNHWVRSFNHAFSIQYYSSNITLSIDGNVVLDLDGCFNPGKFGFFNSSQPNVTYSNFTSTPKADFTYNNNVCQDTPINTNIFCNTIPNPYQQIRWDFGDGTIINNVTNASHTYQSSGTYNIKLYILDLDGCEDSITKPVTIFPNPQTNFTVEDVCLNEPSIFMNTSSINTPDNIATYNWTFGDGNSSTLANPNHIYANEGTFQVKLVLASNNGCLDSMLTTTRVNPKPTAAFNVNDDCVNIAAQFTDNSTISSGNISNWEWNFDDGTPLDFNQNPSHFYSNDGTYQPVLIVTSDFGCKDTMELTTNRHAIPLVDFAAVPVCQYDSISFINNSSINAPSTISNWIWNFGDGSPFSAADNPKHLYNLSGIYNVSLIASSNFGCVGDISLPIQVYPIPTANFSNTSVCENKPPMYFIDISAVNNGSITQWEWDFGDGNTSNFQIPSNAYASAGSYDVQLIVTSNNDCVDTVEIPVTVDPKPNADFLVDINEGCSPVCVTYADNSTANATNIEEWQWNLGNGEGSSQQNPTTCYVNNSPTDDVDYSISLIVKNDLGCYDTVAETNLITSWHNPVADFEITPEETNMYEGEIETFNNSIGAITYAWNFNNGDSSDLFEPVVTYSDTGTYNIVLAVATENNCVDTAIVPIYISPVVSVYIPNSFTPNGDGQNDGFIYNGFGIDPNTTEFSIFDRWGTQIYYTEDGTPWDGLYKGEDAVQDTYVYKFNCKDVLGDPHEYIGHFFLLR